jgi:transcriptional regulator GlxA family with amidase domain
MARRAGMSRRHFHRSFEEALGKSPARYVRESRLREAARQLAGSSRSIEEIAESLGFANRFHFSRLFRDFVGQSPAAFRRVARTRGKTA